VTDFAGSRQDEDASNVRDQLIGGRCDRFLAGTVANQLSRAMDAIFLTKHSSFKCTQYALISIRIRAKLALSAFAVFQHR
jgi:hypothetical protein